MTYWIGLAILGMLTALAALLFSPFMVVGWLRDRAAVCAFDLPCPGCGQRAVCQRRAGAWWCVACGRWVDETAWWRRLP